MSQTHFFYGTLRDLKLLEIVLGRSDINYQDATLKDHKVFWVQKEPFPMVASYKGVQSDGILVKDLSDEDVARLRFYEGGFEYNLIDVNVQTKDGPKAASVFFPDAGIWEPGAPWSLDVWQDQWSEVSYQAAREVMMHFGKAPAKHIATLLPFLRARAWTKELSQDAAPTTLRRDTHRSEVDLNMSVKSYSDFFRLDSFEVRFPKFDGTKSDVLKRAAFIGYDAALVLPYDPVNDLLLLVEQMRFGPLLRGDPYPWLLEPVAGLVDAKETPIETARREAAEEAGLTLNDIRPILKSYPSPAYSTEFFHYFLGVCSLDPAMEGNHGLASENEDIRTHVISFDRAMTLLDSGEINSSPLAMMLLWLARQRENLRAEAM